MPRIALGVEYVGTNYSGWQSQSCQSVSTIQTRVERAIAAIANHPVSIICAGRTDAGVHACGQVVHCDVATVRSMRAWVFGCNSALPRDISILWVQEVADDFNARRSALSRHYKYVIYNHSIRPSLMNDYAAWYYLHLDELNMQLAAQSWLGRHDFSSFRAAGCQSRSPVREVKMITVQRIGDLVIIDILADAFLYHMVRNMVGVLLQIGSGQRPTDWAHEVLLARSRAKAGITAPPQGLYLYAVRYPDGYQIQQEVGRQWFLR